MRLKTIVTVTDFSAQAEHSLDRAALLARAHQAQLRVVYGAEVPSAKFADPFARLEQRCRQLARRHGIVTQAVSGSGDLLKDALTLARGADLLVLDRRLHRAWPQFWRGSTIDQIISRSSCPVLVVQQPPQGEYAQILVAVDFSEMSRSLVRYASGFETGAALELFHAMDTRNKARVRCAKATSSIVRAYRRLALKHAQDRLFRVTDSFDARRNRVGTLRGRKGPVGQITVQQESSHADLVVVGKSRPPLLANWLAGSMAHELVAGLDCDVLVVPHDYHAPGPEKGREKSLDKGLDKCSDKGASPHPQQPAMGPGAMA